MRLWVGRPVPGEEGGYDLRPLEVAYTPEDLRRLNRFPLVLFLGLAVCFGAASVVLFHVPGEAGGGAALWAMLGGAVVSTAGFIHQLRVRFSMRREPEKFAKRAYLASDAAEGEVVFTDDDLAEGKGGKQPCA
jgi:hypothetical protein